MAISIIRLTGVLCGMLLAGCAGEADFGRAKPNELSFLKDIGARFTAETTEPSHQLPMTAEEAQIRTLIANVGRQASLQPVGLFEQILQMEPDGGNAEVSDYYQRLRQIHRESGVSLLNAFGNDVLRDIAIVDQFARLSVGVTKADAARLGLVRRAMESDRAAFSDAVGVVLRVEENGKVIDQMADLMSGTLDQYAEALELAAFEVPEQGLVATIAEALKVLTVSVKGIRADAAEHRAVRGELFARRSSELPI